MPVTLVPPTHVHRLFHQPTLLHPESHVLQLQPDQLYPRKQMPIQFQPLHSQFRLQDAQPQLPHMVLGKSPPTHEPLLPPSLVPQWLELPSAQEYQEVGWEYCELQVHLLPGP